MKILDVPQSGSMAGTTSSRNRFGQYRRTRAIPVQPRSTFQGTMRNRLAANSAAWRTLTDAQRAGWDGLAGGITRTDALGQSYTMTGPEMYVALNNNKLDAGDAVVPDAPAPVTPGGAETVTITTTGGTLSIAYTVTPLPANTRLFIYASPQRSAGRRFENDLRLIAVTAAAAASPHNLLAAYTARFGAPVVGNKIFFSLHYYNGGFLGGPLRTSKVVTA